MYQPTLQTLSLPAQTMFSGDTRDTDIDIGYGGVICYAGEWYMRPGSMSVSYLDGHVRAFHEAELDDWASFSFGATTGEFLIRFTLAQSCNGTFIHTLPAMVVE